MMIVNSRFRSVAFSAGMLAASVAGLSASNPVYADGNERLGQVEDPTIVTGVENSTGFRIGGMGLHGTAGDPDSFSIELKQGETVERVLLYWQLFDKDNAMIDTVLTLNRSGDMGADESVEVTGTIIGQYYADDDITSPDLAFYDSYSATMRADITDYGLIQEGSNTFSISDLDSVISWGDSGRNGAGIMLFYSDGSGASIQLADGHDAVWWKGKTSNLDSSEPVWFEFEPADEERTADLKMFVASVEGMLSRDDRPSVIKINVGTGGRNGTVTDTFVRNNAVFSKDGDEWDNYEDQLTIPAGSDFVKVRIYSAAEGDVVPPKDANNPDPNPASMVWVAAGLGLQERVTDACDCRPEKLTFKFVGGTCDATTNDQNGYLGCYGSLKEAQDMRIYAWGRRNKVDNRWVSLGETFTVYRKYGGELPKATKLIMKSGHDRMFLKLKTSCKQPLAIGDRFGPLELVDFEAADECKKDKKRCHDKRKQGYQYNWKAWKHSKWYRDWKHYGG